MIAACSVFAVAVVVIASIFIIKAVKKTPDKQGEAKPVASVLTSADELMQSGDLDGALALLAATPEDDENYDAAMEKIADLCIQKADALYAEDETAYDASIAVLNQGLGYTQNERLSTALEKYQEIKQSKEVKLVAYTGVVEHWFTHALIAFPEITLETNSEYYWKDCITPYEFKHFLQALYDYGFILIDPAICIENPSGDGKTFAWVDQLMLPEGKKPLIMSFDDVVYDSRKMHCGMVDKIIVDENGELASYTKHLNGEEVISYDNEFIPIIEQFCKEHPDFSHNGAKGVIALTGFAGVLGYRTNRQSENRESEIEEAKKVVAVLKEHGWTFASHSYSHTNFANASLEKVQDDTQKWQNEVQNIVGETPVFVYPFGARIPNEDPRIEVLKNAGFKLFCGVGSKNAINWEMKDGTLLMDRRTMDGTALNEYQEIYKPFLDVTAARDPLRPAGH
ncbi:MAG: polysaccharide deacetylase family protein [Clostridiales bacterium]|nr:polysaccharide deacetylase family protein [Clostridiales bacterium]